MMKKLLLMSAVACIGALSSNAQYLSQPGRNARIISGENATYKLAAPESFTKSTAKTTATGTREYDHLAYMASISAISTDSLWACRIWADSTIQQSFSTGLGKINYSSVAQVIFPFDTIFNDVSNPNFLGQMRITSATPYRVDSVKIQGFYISGALRPAGIVDTLVISLAQQSFTYTYYVGSVLLADYGIDISNYLDPADKDTFRFIRPLATQASTRTVLSYSTAPARVTWKVPMTDAMRAPLATANLITISEAPPGGPYAISAGNVPVVSFTFKSGDTWTADVSHIDSFHRFLPAFVGTNKIMPVKGRFVNEGDHSGSALMFSTSPDSYSASASIEATNDVEFRYEYLAAQMVMSCPTCGLVEETPGSSIKETGILANVNAFPNPANSTLNVPFTIGEKATVNVSISNMVGQVIATQNMGTINAGQKATATFNTSNLANGVYMYTVEANGQRVSNRFSVAH